MKYTYVMLVNEYYRIQLNKFWFSMFNKTQKKITTISK